MVQFMRRSEYKYCGICLNIVDGQLIELYPREHTKSPAVFVKTAGLLAFLWEYIF